MLPTQTSSDGGGEAEMLRSAAGPGYAREWALFCDYTAATGQPALPTTVTALTGFLTQVPARGTTPARRVAAIAAAHRHAGYLPPRPTHTTQTATPDTDQPDARPDPGQMLAACPTRGWPHGFLGRRDGFLIVLTSVLGYSRTQARHIQPTDITTSPSTSTNTDTGTEIDVDTDPAAAPRIRGSVLPSSDDPRTCPACAAVRWLDILGIADGLGRGSARMHLTAASQPTSASPHHHTLTDTARWRHAAQLLPAIDRHGWIDDYRSLSTRSIHTRLALAALRAASPGTTHPQPQTHHPPTPVGAARQTPSLEEALTLLDQVANDADAVNHRIQALLADDTLRNT
jgi:hypothetical protein